MQSEPVRQKTAEGEMTEGWDSHPFKRVLIVRFSSIGDLVLTTPVIRCCRLQWNAEVDVVTRRGFAAVLEGNPYIRRHHVFDRSVREVLPALQAEGYDLVIDLHRNLRSFRLRQALGVRAITFRKWNFRKWLLTALKIDRLPRVHLVDRYFEALRPWGIRNDDKGLDLFLTEGTAVADLPVHGPYVAVALGAAHATKRMPVALLQDILEGIRMPVVLLGGPTDAVTGDALADPGGPMPVVNMAGRCSLAASADLIRHATVVVTPDTGLMHFAAALRRPVVSVWGNTVPAFGMYPYLPGGGVPDVRFEVDGLACRPCSKIGHDRCPKGHFRCMMDQPADRIASRIQALATERT